MTRPQHTPLRVAFSSPIPKTVRGQVLCLVSVIIGAKGVGYMLGFSSYANDVAMSLLTQWIPIQLIGAVMVGICGFAWFTSYCHHGRDKYGYDALTGLASGLTSVYLISSFEGPAYGIQGVFTWLAITVLITFLRRIRDVRDEPRGGTQ